MAIREPSSLFWRRLFAEANEPRSASVPPARIVPMLADQGVYLGSESSIARVLKAAGQNVHRGRAKAPKASRRPTTHIATAPRRQARSGAGT